MKLDELERRALKLVVERDGVTVGELVDELAKVGYKKYDAFKAVESLASKNLVKLVEVPGKFDPYSPAWTKSAYATEEGKKLLESEEKTEKEECSVTLVLTHPFPTETDVKYVSFQEAIELLLSEGDEAVGVVGFVNVNSLTSVLGSILQKLRKPISIRLLCTKVVPENDEVSKRKAIETLEAMGARLELVEVRDDYRRNLHAKFLTSGDLSYVGSHNLLVPALSKNLEVGLLVRGEHLADELRKTVFGLGRRYRVPKHDGF